MDKDALISILVVNIDYKMTNCQSLDNDESLVYRPVIRVYGSTDIGQRACAHIYDVSLGIVLSE